MQMRLLAAAAALLTWGGLAQAQVVSNIQLRFADNSDSLVNSFTVANVGDTINVKVYLVDTNPISGSGSNQTNILLRDGVLAAGLGVRIGDSTVAQVLANSDVSGNSAFSFVNNNVRVNATDATVQNSSFATAGVAATQLSASSRVFLGTFRYTALAAGTTTLSFYDYQTGSTNVKTAAANGTGTLPNGDPFGNLSLDSNTTNTLDPNLFTATASFTVTPVPEPTSLGLVGLTAAGYAFIRRRRATAISA